MCFSATASFSAAAVLIPAGAYALRRARAVEPRFAFFAAFPVGFGLQQAIEGLNWIGIASENELLITYASRGFVFFSHFFWLLWVPLAAWVLTRKPWMGWLAVLGGLYGLSLAAPAVLSPDWLQIEVRQNAIAYHVAPVWKPYVPPYAMELTYFGIILAGLLGPAERRLNIFAGLIAAAVVVTVMFFNYAFASVWCFFAAVLSAYLVMVIGWTEDRNRPPREGLASGGRRV